jgi:hypothetical protein
VTAFLAQPNGIVALVEGRNMVEMQTSSSLISRDGGGRLENLAKMAAARVTECLNLTLATLTTAALAA